MLKTALFAPATWVCKSDPKLSEKRIGGWGPEGYAHSPI